MTETFSVRLVGGSDGERATFEINDVENRCLLTCRYRDKTISAEAADFLTSFPPMSMHKNNSTGIGSNRRAAKGRRQQP
jgi:hypothetical protein